MSAYNMFKTDPEMEKGGVTIDYGDFKFKIARAGGHNTAFLRAMEREAKPYRRAIQNESITVDIAEEILRKVYADTVILGWEGMKDEQGKDLPFTKENCLKVLRDLPDLFNDLKEMATKLSLFRAEVRETEAKN